MLKVGLIAYDTIEDAGPGRQGLLPVGMEVGRSTGPATAWPQGSYPVLPSAFHLSRVYGVDHSQQTTPVLVGYVFTLACTI